MSPRAPLRALAALALLAAPAARAADPFACELRVSASPGRLTLGEDPGATIRVEGRAGAAAPTLLASTGSIGAPREVAPGAWEADYVAPRRHFPQVALVAALGDAACGFTAIPLAAQADALVDTAPGASATVRIGERRFGPARANDRGRAVVPVIVPPGVRAAYHGAHAVALDVPPSRHVLVAVAPRPEPPRADRAEALRIVAFAVTEDGAPWRGEPPALRVSAGEISPPRPAASGAFTARWTIPAGPARAETVSAKLAEEPLSAEARLERAAGPPATLEVRPERARFTAGEPSLGVAVRVADAAGNPTDADVHVRCDLAPPVRATRSAPGRYRAELALSPSFDGRPRANVAARAGVVEGTASVELAPGPPTRLEVAPTSRQLPADARATTALLVRVLDAFGNDARAGAPELEAGLGSVAPVAAAGPGFAAIYRAPRLDRDAADTVLARAGPLRARADLALAAPAPWIATAGRAGVAMLGGSAAVHAGAQVATYRRIAGRELGLALDFGWTFSSKSGPVAAAGAVAPGAIQVDSSTQHLSFLAGPSWRRRGGRLTWWTSAGAGAALAIGTLRVRGEPTLVDSGWVPAVGGAVAVGARAWGGLPFVELRAGWQRDPQLPHLHGALVPITLSLGYRHEAF